MNVSGGAGACSSPLMLTGGRGVSLTPSLDQCVTSVKAHDSHLKSLGKTGATPRHSGSGRGGTVGIRISLVLLLLLWFAKICRIGAV